MFETLIDCYQADVRWGNRDAFLNRVLWEVRPEFMLRFRHPRLQALRLRALRGD